MGVVAEISKSRSQENNLFIQLSRIFNEQYAKIFSFEFEILFSEKSEIFKSISEKL